MSRCQGCLQRMCRKHPLQDHGERAAKLQSMAKEAQKANIASLLQSQISKLEAEAKAGATDHEEYKSQLDLEREQLSKKRKTSSLKLIDPEKAAKYAGSGLNPAVLSMMIEHSDDEGSHSSRGSSSSSSSSSSEDRKKSTKEKKKRKHKKKESKSDSKKRKKDKHSSSKHSKDRDRDRDSEERHRKRRKHDGSSSSSEDERRR